MSEYISEQWDKYTVNEQSNDKVPFAVYEHLGDRLDRANKRFFISLVLAIVLLVSTNLGWLYYESQYKVEETTMIDAEQDGELNIIGGGYVHYGETESSYNKDQKESP